MKAYQFQPGDRFGDWELLKEVLSEKGHRQAQARCSCGSTKIVNLASVRSGQSRSCGTCRRSMHSRRHGMWNSVEYRTWAGMKQRCLNQKASAFYNYGGRGITVCQRWMTFENFLADMGPRPSSKHSVERRDVNGHYDPTNCFWATAIEQGRNKRDTKWKRIVLLLAGSRAAEVEQMVDSNLSDEEISSHIARVYYPQPERASA